MLWEFSTEQWIVSFGFICCVTFIGGWLADRILGYSGFSVIGNWLILLVGAYVGLICYNMFGYRFHWESHFTLALATGSALALLFTMLSIRTLLHIE